MPCKNICRIYRATKERRGSYYSNGNKRCQICDVFIKWKGIKCPCCGGTLRTKPRNTAKLERINMNASEPRNL
jgi:hypothetical protein